MNSIEKREKRRGDQENRKEKEKGKTESVNKREKRRGDD